MVGHNARSKVARRMGVGDVIDSGFGLARHNFGFLLRTAAWALVPGFLMACGIDFVFQNGTVGGLVLVLSTLLAGVALALACDSIVNPAGLPEMKRTGVLYRFAISRVPALIVLGILAAILVLPLFVIVPLGVFLAVRWSMVFNSAILEGNGPISALRESWRITRGSFWHTLGILVVTAILGLVFTFLVDAIFGIVDVALILALKSTALAVIISNLANGLGALLLLPFATAISVMLFYELKLEAISRRDARQAQMPAPANESVSTGV